MDERTEALTALAENERKRAVTRFGLLRPYLEDGVPLARIAHEQEVTPRTLERWVARYRAEGLAGLGRRKSKSSAKRGTGITWSAFVLTQIFWPQGVWRLQAPRQRKPVAP